MFPLAANAGEAFPPAGPLRLYDLTPVSETNPVVAQVKACGIEIPASEFRAFLEAEIEPDKREQPLTSVQKRAHLDKLLDEHFLLWDGRQHKGDETPDVVEMLKFTRATLMQNALVDQEVGAKAKDGDRQRLERELVDRIFDRTDVVVGQEAYEELKVILKKDSFAAAPARSAPEPSPAVASLSAEVRDRALARCKVGTVTTGYLLDFYLRLAPERRPDLAMPAGMEAILKQILAERLLFEEARARGLDALPEVRNNLLLNRSALTRMSVLDRVRDETAKAPHEPGFDLRVRQWYDDHLKDRYTVTNDHGARDVVGFEAAKEDITNDFLDHLHDDAQVKHLQALRQGRKIEINEPALKSIELAKPRDRETATP